MKIILCSPTTIFLGYVNAYIEHLAEAHKIDSMI